jgi:ketosteroid isomerase-like protein
MKEANMTTDHDQIEVLRAEWLEAAQSRNLDRIMATYYPGADYLAFDVMPPFSFEGWDTFRAHWKRFFDMFDADPVFERADTRIHCSGDLAFSTGFTRFAASVGGKAVDLWTRETLCYRKFEGEWRIFHDHVSVPIDLETHIGVTNFIPEA